MNELEFSFEPTPVEALLEAKKSGDSISGVNLLAMLEGEEETYVEEVLDDILNRGLILDISSLPKATLAGEAAQRLHQEVLLVKNGLKPSDLPETDPLRLYLEEVAATPAAGDESVLAERSAQGDEAAMAALTNLGLSRVFELAQKYVGCGVLLLDLIQEGSMGLWQAICSYVSGDYGKHRDLWIRNSLARCVLLYSRSSGVGQKMRSALEDYRAVDERLLSELGRNATLEEIAEQMHMTVEETQLVKKMLDDARLLQQAKQSRQPAQPDPEDEQAVEDTAYFQARQRIMELLSVLSPEDAELLTLRFGLEKGVPMSPQETASRLGITPDEVVAREAAALAKLRTEK